MMSCGPIVWLAAWELPKLHANGSCGFHAMRKIHFPVILQSNWQRSGCFSLVLSLPDIHILPNPFLTIWSVFSPGICLSFAPDLNRVEKRACITQLLHCSGTVTRPHSEYCTYIDQLERLPTTAISNFGSKTRSCKWRMSLIWIQISEAPRPVCHVDKLNLFRIP